MTCLRVRGSFLLTPVVRGAAPPEQAWKFPLRANPKAAYFQNKRLPTHGEASEDGRFEWKICECAIAKEIEMMNIKRWKTSSDSEGLEDGEEKVA